MRPTGCDRHTTRIRPLILVGVLTVICALIAGCASNGAAAPASSVAGVVIEAPTGTRPSSTLASTGTPVTNPTTTTMPLAPTTTGPPQPITIAFGGDVHGAGVIDSVLRRGANPLASVAPLLTAADIAVVNLETVVGSVGVPLDKAYVFRARPELLTSLVNAGVDVVSTGNNHSADYGREGLAETLHQIESAGLGQMGTGPDAQHAYEPVVVDVRGTKVAFVGIARVGPPAGFQATADRPGATDGHDEKATLAAVHAARALAPIVVVFIHWGIELAPCPEPDEQRLATRMLEAGATAVIGAHPHVLQGIAEGSGKLVAYSLGNFVFYATRPEARRTGVLTVSFSPEGMVVGQRFDPARLDGGRPVLLEGADRDAAAAAFEALAPGGNRCPAAR
jgi:poly-gamma-glutamate capsule biosynthesis protein CapA/YwtB (metallophosphatase superfamily)